jgi:hypothetical protein
LFSTKCHVLNEHYYDILYTTDEEDISGETIMLRVRDVPDTALPDTGWDHRAVCRIITRY